MSAYHYPQQTSEHLPPHLGECLHSSEGGGRERPPWALSRRRLATLSVWFLDRLNRLTYGGFATQGGFRWPDQAIPEPRPKEPCDVFVRMISSSRKSSLS
jgi:hypothetical protein